MKIAGIDQITAALQILGSRDGNDVVPYISGGNILIDAFQPLADEERAIYDGGVSQSFKGYVDVEVTIKIGDILTINGEDHTVAIVKPYDFGRTYRHKKLIIEKGKK
jgi:tRNA threonylcarbamoyladenosine modification (KEOPS) complex Cgi121 subunit